MAATAAPPAAAQVSHSKMAGLRTEPLAPCTPAMWVEPVLGTSSAGTAPTAASTKTAKGGETEARGHYRSQHKSRLVERGRDAEGTWQPRSRRQMVEHGTQIAGGSAVDQSCNCGKD